MLLVQFLDRRACETRGIIIKLSGINYGSISELSRIYRGTIMELLWYYQGTGAQIGTCQRPATDNPAFCWPRIQFLSRSLGATIPAVSDHVNARPHEDRSMAQGFTACGCAACHARGVGCGTDARWTR